MIGAAIFFFCRGSFSCFPLLATEHLDDEPLHHDFTLEPADGERLSNLAGPFDEHLRQIELRLGVTIANRGNVFRVDGEERAAALAERVLRELYVATERETLGGAQVNLALAESGAKRSRNAPPTRRTSRSRPSAAPCAAAARTSNATCTRSPRTTSTSASAPPAPARPISPSRWPSTRSTIRACSG
jgi:hypothetical protein